jgi:RHH-type transcriptional regulator, rel operon repressor / antitoxin RelB
MYSERLKPMLAIRLDPDLEARLTAIAKRTGRTKTFYARAAIQEYIDDMEDYAAAEEALRDYDPAKNVSHEDMKRILGLDA